ncbi:MAG TPA: thermonuclease family protein [Rhodopseudomonas sp.]|uniref:thermonuclease family protein n=1 Tax=Rhodopseudomonas sp. TaxID=1078 RepID=UPI002EDA782B
MYPISRTNPVRITPRSPWRGRFSAALPWVFVLGVAAGTMLPARHWIHWPFPSTSSSPSQRDRDDEAIWQRAGNPSVRHPVEVLRTIDGDTFEARVHLWPGLDMTTRVRLRGIDAPELKAQCAQELKQAEAAGQALHQLLGEGEVTIYNIGPDKYQGRVVADAATKRTPNVSAALLAGGYARSYDGGHREGWCAVR